MWILERETVVGGEKGGGRLSGVFWGFGVGF